MEEWFLMKLVVTGFQFVAEGRTGSYAAMV
jgi:hypothetical protein